MSLNDERALLFLSPFFLVSMCPLNKESRELLSYQFISTLDVLHRTWFVYISHGKVMRWLIGADRNLLNATTLAGIYLPYPTPRDDCHPTHHVTINYPQPCFSAVAFIWVTFLQPPQSSSLLTPPPQPIRPQGVFPQFPFPQCFWGKIGHKVRNLWELQKWN